MTPKRDPRTNPQQGDRVTTTGETAGETREVETVTGTKVIYSWPGKVAVRTVSIDDWRRWCIGATAWSRGTAAEATDEA